MSETQPEPIEEPTPEPEPIEEPEPAEPDAEPEPDDEPEPEPAPEPRQRAITPEEIEERARKSRNAFEAFGRKLFAIHDDFAHDLIECPLCPDMHKGYFNVHDAGRIPEEIKEAVMQLLGYAREAPLEQSPDHHRCPICAGRGKLKTDSLVPGKEKIGCAKCHGVGFIGPTMEQSNGHAELDPEMSGPLVHGLEPPAGEVDAWNEPRILPDGRENPNYGKMPNFKIPVEPWGVTAGLTVQDAIGA